MSSQQRLAVSSRALALNVIFIVLWVGLWGFIHSVISLIHKNKVWVEMALNLGLFAIGCTLMLIFYTYTSESFAVADQASLAKATTIIETVHA